MSSTRDWAVVILFGLFLAAGILLARCVVQDVITEIKEARSE